MFSWLSSAFGAANPLMLWGGLAVASPILIHLLSRRKFRIVDWAAMDFLLEANRKNRRRVKLENLIILLLRCLAMALLAMLIARPFLTPAGASAKVVGSDPFERIFILDDSPSMAATKGQEVIFDGAKKRITDFLDALLEEQTGDSVTLLLTSNPNQPLFRSRTIDRTSVQETTKEIESLEVSDRSADLSTALLELGKLLEADEAKQANRAVYLVTDLQEKDWPTTIKASQKSDSKKEQKQDLTQSSTSSAIEKLTKVDDKGRALIQGFVLVDVGTQIDKNLVVTDIAMRDQRGKALSLIAEQDARFEVSVFNSGTQSAENVPVTLEIVDYDTLPTKEIKSIAPGETQKVAFTFTAPSYKNVEDGDEPDADANTKPMRDIQIRARVGREDDQLRLDDERIFATKLSPGTQVLMVDGYSQSDENFDPDSERHFIQYVIGLTTTNTGFQVRWVSETQFESLDLKRYQLIYILNVTDLSPERIKALNTYVSNGGRLIFAIGKQVDLDFYNRELYRLEEGNEGSSSTNAQEEVIDPKTGQPTDKLEEPSEALRSLLPVKLIEIAGSDNKKSWVYITPKISGHRTTSIFEIPLFAQTMNVFQYWNVKADPDATVIARYTNADETPAIVEKSIGKKGGRVIVFMNTLNIDWTNWPSSKAWGPFVMELSKYMAANTMYNNNIVPGQQVSFPIDPSKYKENIGVAFNMNAAKSKVEKTSVTALRDEKDTSSQLLRFDYPDTNRAGLYKFLMTHHDGTVETKLFAANIAAEEGNLSRIEHKEIVNQLPNTKIDIVTESISSATGIDGAKTELWKYLLLAVGIVLGLEQFCAWFFGKKRSS